MSHEIIILEKRLKNGLGDEVLSQHINGVVDGEGLIDVVAEPVQKLIESIAVFAFDGDQLIDARLVAFGNDGDITPPRRPIKPVADLLDDARDDSLVEIIELKFQLIFLRHVDDELFILTDNIGIIVEGEFIDLDIKLIVVGAKGVEHLPDGVEILIVIEFVNGIGAFWNDDGQNDIAEVFAVGFTHNAPDGLNDIDGGFARRQKHDGVESGHVDALRQATGVG